MPADTNTNLTALLNSAAAVATDLLQRFSQARPGEYSVLRADFIQNRAVIGLDAQLAPEARVTLWICDPDGRRHELATISALATTTTVLPN